MQEVQERACLLPRCRAAVVGLDLDRHAVAAWLEIDHRQLHAQPLRLFLLVLSLV